MLTIIVAMDDFVSDIVGPDPDSLEAVGRVLELETDELDHWTCLSSSYRPSSG